MSPRRWLDPAALAGLLVLTACLRLGALGVLHDRGDQLIWQGLARNVAARGLEGYTVRGIDARLQVVPGRDDLALWRAELAPLTSATDPNVGNGSLVQGLVAGHESYWDAPLANQPPVYTALLVGSHALLGRENDGWPLVGRAPRGIDGHPGSALEEDALARSLAHERPRSLVRAQAWATFPPLASDVLTVALLWWAGVSVLGSRRAALLLGLAYATDPLALFASHRVLSNSTLATVTLAALLAWARAATREGPGRTRGLALAGLVAGLAIAIKASAIFLLPLALVGHVLARRRLPDRGTWAFVAVGTLVNAPWWWLTWRTLGNPLGMPWERLAHWAQDSDWGRHVTGRGLGYYPGVLALSPLVALGVLGAVLVLLWALIRARAGRPRPGERARLLEASGAFALLVLAAAQVHSGGKEARHLLLAYPPLLLVAGAGLEPLRRWLGSALGSRRAADAGLVLALGLVFLFQAHQGLTLAYATSSVP